MAERCVTLPVTSLLQELQPLTLSIGIDLGHGVQHAAERLFANGARERVLFYRARERAAVLAPTRLSSLLLSLPKQEALAAE
jgi:hypothetical protein